MSQRLRTRVWRELPFSARRAIVGSLRAVDHVEVWLLRTWRSLHHSPAWLFVAIVGSAGIVLTVILFLTLTKELMAANSGRAVEFPIIEPERTTITERDDLDSRLCLDDVPAPLPQYAAEFRFAIDRSRMHASTARPRIPVRPAVVEDDFPPLELPQRRTPVKPIAVPELPDDSPPLLDFAPQVAEGTANLLPRISFLHHRLPQLSRREVSQTLVARAIEPRDELTPGPRIRDGWDAAQALVLDRPVTPEPYAGDAGAREEPIDEEAAFADVQGWPDRAEIGFRVELHAPERATVSQPGRSSLVIRNDSGETIRRLQIAEPMRDLDLVTGAAPAGLIQHDVLLREILRLRSGREKSLALDWFPTSRGDRRHSAQVLAEAYVAAAVHVTAAPLEGPLEPTSGIAPDPFDEPPVQPIRRRNSAPPLLAQEPLPEKIVPEAAPENDPPPVVTPAAPEVTRAPAVECTVQANPTVAIDDIVELKIDVRNTGQVILHNVRLVAEVPAELRHRNGTQLEYDVGRLSRGASHQAVLKLMGGQAGRAVTKIKVVADEDVEASAAARLAVVAAPAERATARPVSAPAERVRTPAAPTRVVFPQRDPCCGCFCGPQVVWIGP